MRIAHVRLLRKSLIGLIILVLVAVGYNYVQTWRHRARIVRQAANILSTDMMRSADSIEYSEQENGRARFKLRAQKLLETRQGKNLLEGIEASDLNPDGTTDNQIRSRKAEYDRDGKKAFFYGDVRILMHEGAEIRTDSLRYDLDRNVGETDDSIELISKQARGTARGVKYDHANRTLELRQEVRLTFEHTVRNKEGQAVPETVHVQSQRGYYSEAGQLIRWQGDARLDSDTSTLSGNDIEATFSEDKRRVTSLVCRGDAVYRSKDPVEAQTLQGDTMDFGINRESGTVTRIDVRGRAAFSTQSSGAQQVLGGSEIHLELDPDRGSPTSLQARGDVRFRSRRGPDETVLQGSQLEAGFLAGKNLLEKMRVWGGARMTNSSGSGSGYDELKAEEIIMSFRDLGGQSSLRQLDANRSVTWISSPGPKAGGSGNEAGRTLKAAFLQMLYSDTGDFLESGFATGNVELTGLPASATAQIEMRRMKADTVHFQFYPHENKLKGFSGEGHVEIFYHRSANAATEEAEQEFHTSSLNMRASFRQADGEVENMSQWGNFVYQDGTRTATSGRSDYSADKDLLVLRESPKISDSGGTTTGELVSYDRKAKIMRVKGNVRSILKSKEGADTTPFSSSSGSASPSVVTAESMQYWTEGDRVQYAGKVQMLSENGQLQASTLDILESGEKITAEGGVRHLVIRSEAESDSKKHSKESAPDRKTATPGSGRRSPVLICSDRLHYVKSENAVHYSGMVTLRSEDLLMSSDTMDAVFESTGRRIERATARGKVDIRQAGREVKGSTGDYFLTPGKFVVTGEMAELTDPQRGKSTARRLTFFTADDRILLENR